MAYRDGALLVTQQTEVTRIMDQDGDGRADRFDTLSDKWGIQRLPRICVRFEARQGGQHLGRPLSFQILQLGCGISWFGV